MRLGQQTVEDTAQYTGAAMTRMIGIANEASNEAPELGPVTAARKATAHGEGSALADRLLRRPRSDDDKPADRWAYPAWIMVLVSLAIAYHTMALLAHNLSGKGVANGARTFFIEQLQGANYMRATGNIQNWAMFAPNPYRTNVFIKVRVLDRDGEIFDLAHDIHGRRHYPYLFYDRMGKINRRLNQTGYRRNYAAWVCRQWEMDHDGQPAEEVQFLKSWTRVPPPQKVFKDMGYDPMSLHVSEREEDTIPCSSLAQAQLSPELRERLGLPESDLEANKKSAKEESERKAAKDDDGEEPDPMDEMEGGE
jgi:hypothetical protein